MPFFRSLTRFPAWPRHYLRTTSLRERLKRLRRRLFRAAAALAAHLNFYRDGYTITMPFTLACRMKPVILKG